MDSLCIIQDDHVKTAKEIALMTQIYKNAHITISAARSSNSHEGFLHDISAPSARAKVFRLPYLCENGNTGSVIIFIEPGSVQSYDPIERRAWPRQEFLLSRRVLKYGSYQMSWTCPSVDWYENEKNDWSQEGVNADNDWWLLRDSRISDLRRSFIRSPPCLELNGELWRDIVKEYTSRELSDPKDRLLAISGIATALGDVSKDSYLAGLWLNDFPAALLWEIASPLDPRPHNYRAPSWSWAPVDGLVAFPIDLDINPDLKLLSYSMTLVESSAPYGAVKAGYIEIMGRMSPARWNSNRRTLVDIDAEDLADFEAITCMKPDSAEKSPEPIIVWCLQICAYAVLENLGPSGLILTTMDEKVFKRVGTFFYDPWIYKIETPAFFSSLREAQQGWADGSEIRTIIIE